MSYKTILVHCDASKSVSHRLGVAVDLAQRFGARLVGLHVRRPFETPVFADGSFPMDDFFKAHEEGVKADEAGASAAFAKAIKGKELATEWRLADGYVDGELPVQARYADLVVLGQAEPEPTATPSDLPETVALATGRPVLVVPHIGAKPPGRPSCCAGMPAARLHVPPPTPCRFSRRRRRSSSWPSIPRLRPQATAPNRARTLPPGSPATASRSRSSAIMAPDADVGGVILSRAADLGADLIVMGIYGHSRMREMVLGGASRTLLGSMTVPVFMSH